MTPEQRVREVMPCPAHVGMGFTRALVAAATDDCPVCCALLVAAIRDDVLEEAAKELEAERKRFDDHGIQRRAEFVVRSLKGASRD